jgi:1-acyl-sn-glycerol-3-phosphate acyltransferase
MLFEMHWVYYFGRGLIRTALFLIARWEVKGRENVPEGGPMLIVSNHLHIADPPIVAASIPLRLVFMAKEELWESRWSRFWVENFGAFPVRRGGLERGTLRAAEEWIKRGVSVVIFPEGGRSPSASLRSALPGAALMARRLKVPILPVGISGTDKFNHMWWALRHRPRVTVTIGRPFSSPMDGKPTREQRQETMEHIMKNIAALLPPQYRGVYAGEDRAADREG